ncbi:CD209 antigen-like protein E [Cyprinodon tularosa]|uniref:CD209 antigen-like protein E n=1 Tax=Cyprinodon tularosa TaxID=77115 RepID=UPI0018E232C2|nr:CD209 antigen-like protein E [Cyprinodon tularosa]
MYRNPVEVQQTGQSRRSKVISKRIVLLVLIAVLAATVIFLAVNETCLKCEAGWELYEGNCYDFSNTTSTWNESRDLCIDVEGDLVKIDSRDEQRKVKEKITNDEDSFWIGLRNSEKEGSWVWVDGSPLNKSLSFWGKNEPDGKGGGPESEMDCVRIKKKQNSVKWFDRYCNDALRSICEKAAENQLC